MMRSWCVRCVRSAGFVSVSLPDFASAIHRTVGSRPVGCTVPSTTNTLWSPVQTSPHTPPVGTPTAGPGGISKRLCGTV